MANAPERRFETNINLEGHDLLNVGDIASLKQYLTQRSIDYANPVVLAQASTLQTNKAHTLTGTGYALALPASPAIGDLLFVLVAGTATGLYALTGTPYALYARESLTLRYTVNGWTKIGGELLPMVVRLETSLTQQDAVPPGDLYTVPLSQTIATISTLPGIVNGSSIVVQRSGQGLLSGGVTLKNCDAASAYFFGIAVNRAGSVFYPAQLIAAVGSGLSQQIVSVPASAYQAGDVLSLYIYAQGAGANLRGEHPGSQSFLTYTEIV